MKKKPVSKQPSIKINIDTHQKTIVEIKGLIEDKVCYIQEIIRNTIFSINYYKKCDIFSNSDVVICINTLVDLYNKTVQMLEKLIHIPKVNVLENTQTHPPPLSNDLKTTLPNNSTFTEINLIIDELQQIIDKISIVVCGFGTKRMSDLLYISFGSDFRESEVQDELLKSKFELILKHIMPIGYKTIHWKNNKAPSKDKYIIEKRPINVVLNPISPQISGLTPEHVHTLETTSNNSTLSNQFGLSGMKDTETKETPVELATNVNIDYVCSNKLIEDTIQIEQSTQYECYDADMSTKILYVKLHGIRVIIHNEKFQKTLIIQGLVDDIILDCMSNTYIDYRKHSLEQNIPDSNTYDRVIMNRIIETLTLKDMFIYGNSDIYKRHIAIMSEVNSIKYNKLNLSIKRFLEMDVYSQRQMLMNLLIYNKEDDIQYITYLLYDLITDSVGNATDSVDQMLIYDSFPWKIKLFFKDTMKNTIKFTKEMVHKYDINRVSLEQQIYVMKVPENVKEKAMMKLKEIKGKNDDSGTKAKQYLEGLLKIPFGIYCEEPILKKIKTIQTTFTNTLLKNPVAFKTNEFTNSFEQCPRESSNMGGSHPSHSVISKSNTKRDRYTTCEMVQYIDNVKRYIREALPATLRQSILTLSMKCINQIYCYINTIYKTSIPPETRKSLLTNTKKKEDKIEVIVSFLQKQSETHTLEHIVQIYDIIAGAQNDIALPPTNTMSRSLSEYDKIYNSICDIKTDLDEITHILDESIHGHSNAKRQILKIIGQWMSGEQTGYCFGFEGSPGIGKTSLAKKGLANCLKNGSKTRPFSFIALGGSCNGSTLEGHSYTYVNSTWGRITDILMETNCMNPIIYIDELDKVSKTEHGKEIIGILMHLIDSTQNTGFQDKYFSGIELDLSKALFIFSYNDPSQIDKILLDRIHRIRFENLSLDEKKVIVKQYIVPELNKKMGFFDTVLLTDEIIDYIIETYTNESGVRKLKEVLFDLFGDINIDFLHQSPSTVSIPLVITEEMLRDRYLTKYTRVHEKKIHTDPEVGVINGLWASANGKGGIIPIQTMLYPASSFLELRLTGLQGDVMKESMNVAKSIAWNMLDIETQREWIKRIEETKTQGLHIHCPEGAVSKDGPSAGAAITLAIYSLFTKRPIRNNVAITGEINLQGAITEIGGLEDKIDGGIKAGITTFLFPTANIPDYEKYIKKHASIMKKQSPAIQYIPVSHIQDTIEHIFVS